MVHACPNISFRFRIFLVYSVSIGVRASEMLCPVATPWGMCESMPEVLNHVTFNLRDKESGFFINWLA